MRCKVSPEPISGQNKLLYRKRGRNNSRNADESERQINRLIIAAGYCDRGYRFNANSN
jgi:hypothetical protein